MSATLLAFALGWAAGTSVLALLVAVTDRLERRARKRDDYMADPADWGRQ